MNAKPSSLVFAVNDEVIGARQRASTFRGHLASVEGIRPVLFQRSATRMPIRIHDLRATFVTLSLANGKTETWVATAPVANRAS